MKKKKSQQGIALIWIIIAGALLITGVGRVASKRTALRIKEFQPEVPSTPLPSLSPSPELIFPPGGVKKEVGEKGEEFVGQIKEVIAKGTPMKCTYTQEGFSGVSFVKGKKHYSEVSLEDGTGVYTIIKDNCMWNWYQGDNQGTKMCFEEDVWNTSEAMPAEAEYHCIPAFFSDSQFEPPADINFIATGETAPLSDEDLLKILPPKERSELESAIRETQEVMKNIEIFTPPTIDDIKGGLKGFGQINKQTQEQIQKNIEKQQQEFQPIDPKKIEEYFNQNPPAVPQEVKELPPEAQEYYYRKYILKDPAFQY